MFDQYKDALIRLLLWLLLISSLVATITNLAWAFSVVSPLGSKAAWFGAVSFDGAVLIISFYARRFEGGSYARKLARGIVLTNTIISIYANVYRAIEFQQQLQRINGAAWVSMPIVLGFALPLLTLALAEVLVLDETQRADEFERRQKKQERQHRKADKESNLRLVKTGTDLAPECFGTGTGTGTDPAQLVLEQVAQGISSHRGICNNTGLGRGTVRKQIEQLVAQGELVKDANGRATISPPVPVWTHSHASEQPEEIQV